MAKRADAQRQRTVRRPERLPRPKHRPAAVLSARRRGLLWLSLPMSDGSERLRFVEPESFEPVRSIEVTFEGKPVKRLNELEWIEGRLWANVWRSDRIAVIDPDGGEVGPWSLPCISPDCRQEKQIIAFITHQATAVTGAS